MGRSSKKTRNSRNKKDGKMKEIKERLIKDGKYPITDELIDLNPMVSSDEQTVIIAETYVKTEAGKEWYYKQISSLGLNSEPMRLKEFLAKLAKYNFPEERGEILK